MAAMAYVGSDSMGLQGIDMADPEDLEQRGASGAYSLEGLVTRDELLFATTTGNQLVTYDISNPAAPLPIGTPLDLDSPSGLAQAGDYLLVCDCLSGLTVVGISDPAAPALLSSTPLQGVPSKLELQGHNASPEVIRLSGQYLFVADSNSGLKIFDILP